MDAWLTDVSASTRNKKQHKKTFINYTLFASLPCVGWWWQLCNNQVFVMNFMFTSATFSRLNKSASPDQNTTATQAHPVLTKYQEKNHRATMTSTWPRIADKKHKSLKWMRMICSGHFKKSCKASWVNNKQNKCHLSFKIKSQFLMKLRLRSLYAKNMSIHFGCRKTKRFKFQKKLSLKTLTILNTQFTHIK